MRKGGEEGEKKLKLVPVVVGEAEIIFAAKEKPAVVEESEKNFF